MRKLIAAFLLTGTAVVGPAIAADMPYYPPVIEIPDVPDVDYGVSGSFYLRGSAAGNAMWAKEVFHPRETPRNYAITDYGYGYSVGAGVGYETGTGLRADVTVDYLSNEKMGANISGSTLPAGLYNLSLRSTVVLANAYYDFGFGEMGYGASGGGFGYVGAGAGVAFNDFITNSPGDVRDTNTSLAAAGMVGVGYDFGHLVADVGYRALYIDNIQNKAAPSPYSIGSNWVHEIRTTLRYRFN